MLYIFIMHILGIRFLNELINKKIKYNNLLVQLSYFNCHFITSFLFGALNVKFQ